MKRVPLKRGQPMKRGSKSIRAKGGDRFPKRRDEAYRDWIRTLPCCVTGCITRRRHLVECAHVKSRGAGGDDVGNCVPLCRDHHEWQHRVGIKSFQSELRLDLAASAARYAERYAAEGAT